MFQALSDFVRASGKVALTVTMKGDDMVVVVMPMTVSKEAVLNQPLTLSGSPAELDEAFAQAVSHYTAARRSLAEQVESTVAIIEAAKKESAGKAQKALAGKAKTLPTSKLSDSEDDDDADPDVSDVVALSAPVKEASPAGTDLLALLA